MKKLFNLIALILCVYSVDNSDAQRLNYTVKNTITVDKPVSPLFYGNIIEMGFAIPWNLWAEMFY